MKALACHLATQRLGSDYGTVRSLQLPEVQRIVRVVEVDKQMEILLNTPLPFLLDTHDDSFLRDAWRKSIRAVVDHLQRDLPSGPPQHAFLGMHASYFRRSRFFSPIDWDEIRRLQPSGFVTLIDDAYIIHKRVRQREEIREPTQSYLKLRDILMWRSVEVLTTDMLSRNLLQPRPDHIREGYQAPRNDVVAVKHPPSMLHDLLFRRDQVRVYSCHPISSTRTRPEVVQAINTFKLKLHNEFVVFDPITIDEKIMHFPQHVIGESIVLTLDDRWPIPFASCLSPTRAEEYPVELPVHEVQEIQEDVDNHIEARDFRMIDQSNVLAAWRPHFGQRHHDGVEKELTHARQVARKPRYGYHPDEDTMPGHPFSRAQFHPFKTEEELLQAIRRYQETEMKKFFRPGP